MNTVVKSKSVGGMTLADEQFVEMKLRGGWKTMWIATFISPFFPLTVISLYMGAVGLGQGIGAMSWPGYGGRGFKLAFWSVMGPLTPWILFITAAVIWRNIR